MVVSTQLLVGKARNRKRRGWLTHHSLQSILISHTEKTSFLHVLGELAGAIERVCGSPRPKCLLSVKEYQLETNVCQLEGEEREGGRERRGREGGRGEGGREGGKGGGRAEREEREGEVREDWEKRQKREGEVREGGERREEGRE